MKTLKNGLSFALVLSLLATNCSVTGPLREDTKASGYRLGALPKPWIEEDLGSGADVVYFNNITKALISVNSVCDRYLDSKLETLTQDLLAPIKSVKVIDQKELTISDRRALLTTVEGRLDGVPVKSTLVVLRKNRCLFDFSIYGTDVSESEYDEFIKFVSSLRFQESK